MNYRETMSRLNAAMNNIDSAYAIIAKRHGLTYNSLMMIYLMDDSENITQKEICDALHLPKSTVHSILIEFIKQGFVIVEPGTNKKEKQISLTSAGEIYIKKILKETNLIERNVFNALGEDICDFLTHTVETLGSLMKKEIENTYGGEV